MSKGFFRTLSHRARLFLPVLLLAFFWTPSLVDAQTACSTWPRDISCYKTLWGTKFDWTKEQIKTANGNGIIYLGPKNDGIEPDGSLKKILTTVSLSVDNDKFRALNMIGSTYTNQDIINIRNKKYLRYLVEAFIVRIYQEDASGNKINVSLSPVSVSPFPDVKDSIGGTTNFNGKSVTTLLNEGKPVDRLLRYRSGSGAFSNASFLQMSEDGYTQDSTDSKLSNPVYTGAAGAAIGSVIPGIGTVIGGIIGAGVGALNTSGPTLVLRQTALITIEIEDGVKLDKTLPTYMELWYAGEDREDTSDTAVRPAGHELNQIPLENLATPEEGDTNDPRIRYFKKSWIDYNDLPYFQIGPTQKLPQLPQSFQEAQTQAEAAISESETINANLGTNATQSILPDCSIDPLSNGSVMGCIAQILYHGVFRPVAFFAQLMGQLFDFFLGYSLSDESYRHEFVQTGWRLVRDISNIFFIIIMIYSGLMAVFNTSSVSYKKVIPTLIINALIINFSLFATRIIIDMSNITARIFYNQMVVRVGDDENAVGAGGFKPISEAIVSSFNPQNLFKNSVLSEEEPLQKEGSYNASGTGVVFNGNNTNPVEGKKFKTYSSEYAAYFSLVTLVAIAISFSVAVMFWKTAFMFVGRVVGLYVAMIFSPFAFLSRGNVPLVSKIGSLNYTSWVKDLTNYALLAPIFVFFLYIINAFLNVEFFTKVGLDQNGVGFFGSVMYVVIPMLIIYGLVTRGVKVAEGFAGEFGKMAQNFANTGAKIAGGVALGGAGFAARGGMGVINKTFGTWAGANKDAGGVKGFAAGGVNKFLQWGQKSSLDIRNAKGFGILNTIGVAKTDDRIAGVFGLGQKDALKGNVGLRKDREKKKNDEITEKNDMSHLTDVQAKKVWEKISEREARANAEKAWEANKTTSPELKILKEKEEELNKKLATAEEAKDTTTADSIRKDLATNAKNQKDTVDALTTVMLADKKDNAHHKTDEYKKNLKDAEDKIKEKYGKVENAKDLSSAMRYQYAQRMLEDSMLLSGGKKRSGMWALGGLLGGTGGGLANNILKQLALGMTTGGASILGGVLGANAMDDAQEAALNVNKKIVKDYEKAHDPKKNRAVKLKKELDELDSLIDSHIDTALSAAGESLTGLDEEAKEKKKKEYFDKARSDAQADTDTIKDEYDEFRKKYNREKQTMSDQEKKDNLEKLKNLADNYRKAKDESDALNNAHKDREWTKNEIEKEEERARNAEDKKKEKDGDKDKPKDK